MFVKNIVFGRNLCLGSLVGLVLFVWFELVWVCLFSSLFVRSFVVRSFIRRRSFVVRSFVRSLDWYLCFVHWNFLKHRKINEYNKTINTNTVTTEQRT